MRDFGGKPLREFFALAKTKALVRAIALERLLLVVDLEACVRRNAENCDDATGLVTGVVQAKQHELRTVFVGGFNVDDLGDAIQQPVLTDLEVVVFHHF